MKTETLELILAAKSSKIPTALLTELESGDQCLFQEGKTDGALAIPDELLPHIMKALARDKSASHEIGDKRYFIQVFNPPKRMIIIGAVHISQALAPIAEIAGFDVTIIDPRTAWASPERFPGITINTEWPDDAIIDMNIDSRTAIVALTHDPKLDDPALEHAIRSKAFYVGALGSKKTHAKRVSRLMGVNFNRDEIDRIDAPIGMDIGALSPAEIAISIMAKITLALNGPKNK